MFEDLVNEPVSWLTGEGPDSEIVLSSRIRLARNLREFRFPPSADTDTRDKIITFVRTAFESAEIDKDGKFYRSNDINTLDQSFLVERHLISPEFMKDGTGRGLYIGNSKRLSIMINEEDHIRLQVISSGLAMNDCWEYANSIDDKLSRKIEYAYDNKFGHLTSCPTNVGTGLRASILIHLPGLVLTREIDNVINKISKVGLVVRGFYGEGTEVLGNLFQVSNQTTLGRSEDEIIDSLAKVTQQIIEYELSSQETLMKDAPDQIEDKVWRSYGILSHARVLSSSEVMNLLSALRLGVSLKIINEVSLRQINELLIITQPAHIQKYYNREMASVERDMVRASLVREQLTSKK
ncbi:MAG: protein arginine kinase [candidate division Zixibacteria bacterium]|nr:protein arginine kinase [candidate division Zixibacteria bacterium]